jgi:hypothetical protein
MAFSMPLTFSCSARERDLLSLNDETLEGNFRGAVLLLSLIDANTPRCPDTLWFCRPPEFPHYSQWGIGASKLL